MNTKDRLLVFIATAIILGVLINYLGLRFFKILALCSILLICFHIKIKQYIHALSPKNQKIATKIDPILTSVYSFFSWIKPIKLGNNFYVDISQMIVILILGILLML